MRGVSVLNHFAFGYNYRRLRFWGVDFPVHGENSLVGAIDEFFAYLRDLDLRVTERATDRLRKIREKIKSLPADTKTDAALAAEVTAALNFLDTTLDAELAMRTAYLPTPKRFDLDSLLVTPKNLLGEDVYVSLPDIARFDFFYACRCIAFELPTAAAFHLMRCTEAVLRLYYNSLVLRNRITNPMWGPIIDHLRKKRQNPPPKALLDHLDNIRNNFRNPTQHPEARYTSDEAQDLLSTTVDVVNRTIRDLRSRLGLKKGQPVP